MRKRSSGRVVGYSYPWDYFRFARNPSRVDAKRGDHFLQADLPLLICRQRVIWRFTARRDCLSGSTGNDHLPNKPVVHREQAIRIPPAPDASASTVTALAPAQVVVRTVSVRLMSNCLRKPIF